MNESLTNLGIISIRKIFAKDLILLPPRSAPVF
jgi:hypothetical protein